MFILDSTVSDCGLFNRKDVNTYVAVHPLVSPPLHPHTSNAMNSPSSKCLRKTGILRSCSPWQFSHEFRVKFKKSFQECVNVVTIRYCLEMKVRRNYPRNSVRVRSDKNRDKCHPFNGQT